MSKRKATISQKQRANQKSANNQALETMLKPWKQFLPAPKSHTPTSLFSGFSLFQHAMEYSVDAMQRSVLFFDVLRQRTRDFEEQHKMKVPHVLHFDAELVLDASHFERPTNYLLARVKPPSEFIVDMQKRPFVIIDPRAGHGPGIGGFKADSEAGVAMRAGHPVYLVAFTPDPMPGQTIEDVMHSEARFLEKVIELHPDAEGKPCIIGNCQAGWAVPMLAAVYPDLCGPIISAGAPLSYWAGERGENPMRYSGGLLGGSWLTALTSDLGNGKFDGSWLVTNFEGLNPANTLWTKQYNVWANVDTEAARYLGFEKWWGGHINLNGDEIQWIVDELFVGNRLASAQTLTRDNVAIDFRNIRSPFICFCSKGDNITPPQQALGWITDLYESDKDILVHNQTIVYAIHENIGHLGIFVSGGIAKKEHSEFTSNIDLIDCLPPGIYEAVITDKAPDMEYAEYVQNDFHVVFEKRSIDDIRQIVKNKPEDDLKFATVQRLSDINLGLYKQFLQPWVKMFANEQAAHWLAKLQPSEMPYTLFTEQNPLVKQIESMAEMVRENRQSISKDNPFVVMQEHLSDQIIAFLENYRERRDEAVEVLFLNIFGSPALQALVGLGDPQKILNRRPGMNSDTRRLIETRIAELKANMEKGDLRTAIRRALVYIGMANKGVDERSFNFVRKLREEQLNALSLPEFKQAIREQFFMLTLDEEKAVAAIPAMLPKSEAERKQAVKLIEDILTVGGKPEGERAQRLQTIKKLFGVTTAASSTGRRRAKARTKKPAANK